MCNCACRPWTNQHPLCERSSMCGLVSPQETTRNLACLEKVKSWYKNVLKGRGVRESPVRPPPPNQPLLSPLPCFCGIAPTPYPPTYINPYTCSGNASLRNAERLGAFAEPVLISAWMAGANLSLETRSPAVIAQSKKNCDLFARGCIVRSRGHHKTRLHWPRIA